MEKFKVYELDFGDTNLLSEDKKVITDWIESDMTGLTVGNHITYEISIRMMTRKEIDELPEWS